MPQVEQILDIFDGGAGEEEDRIDFDAFHSRVVAFLMEGEERVGEMEVQGRRRASTSSQGVFNENLRRSFDKSTSSPARSPGRRARPRRKGSQVGGRCTWDLVLFTRHLLKKSFF